MQVETFARATHTVALGVFESPGAWLDEFDAYKSCYPDPPFNEAIPKAYLGFLNVGNRSDYRVVTFLHYVLLVALRLEFIQFAIRTLSRQHTCPSDVRFVVQNCHLTRRQKCEVMLAWKRKIHAVPSAICGYLSLALQNERALVFEILRRDAKVLANEQSFVTKGELLNDINRCEIIQSIIVDTRGGGNWDVGVLNEFLDTGQIPDIATTLSCILESMHEKWTWFRSLHHQSWLQLEFSDFLKTITSTITRLIDEHLNDGGTLTEVDHMWMNVADSNETSFFTTHGVGDSDLESAIKFTFKTKLTTKFGALCKGLCRRRKEYLVDFLIGNMIVYPMQCCDAEALVGANMPVEARHVLFLLRYLIFEKTILCDDDNASRQSRKNILTLAPTVSWLGLRGKLVRLILTIIDATHISLNFRQELVSFLFDFLTFCEQCRLLQFFDECSPSKLAETLPFKIMARLAEISVTQQRSIGTCLSNNVDASESTESIHLRLGSTTQSFDLISLRLTNPTTNCYGRNLTTAFSQMSTGESKRLNFRANVWKKCSIADIFLQHVDFRICLPRILSLGGNFEM